MAKRAKLFIYIILDFYLEMKQNFISGQIVGTITSEVHDANSALI